MMVQDTIGTNNNIYIYCFLEFILTNLLSAEDLAFESAHIWHPYSSTNSPVPVFPVVAANGVRLTLNDGREIIDGMSSWWCMAHGYNHPAMNKALKDQVDNFSHVMFGGLTHKPAIDLARKLVDMTPEPIQTVFFADSGSVSVEVAIKMAVAVLGVSGLHPQEQNADLQRRLLR